MAGLERLNGKSRFHPGDVLRVPEQYPVRRPSTNGSANDLAHAGAKGIRPAPAINTWGKYEATANGGIAGVGDNKFAPKNTTTEQALVIAVRMVENPGT